MAHHITEPTELFPHLEHRDLQVVHEVKALIQDHLYSGARDYSFQNGLVDFYIRTNSQHAMDILCKVREPWDKPLLDKLNDTMKAGAKLQSLTLLLHIVTRQPSWLYKIVQTNLYASLIQCLKTSCDCSVIMCGLLTITTLLPMIPSLIGPSLHDIFEIFSRFVDWNIQRPGNVPEVYHLHIQTAVYTLFHRLYGMFPWNFLQFLRDNYAKRQQDVNETIMPMLVRVRLHPQLILGSGKIETEAARWRKMEVHDILTECSRISLDSAESARDEWSLYNVSAAGSESGRASSSLSSVVNQARRTSSPWTHPVSTNSTDQRQKQVSQQRLHPRGAAPPAGAASENLVGLVDSTAMIWSPSVFCGLSTPASSRPGSPGSILDSSFNSSLQLMSATHHPTPLNTPRLPRLANLTDDVKAAGYGGTDGASLVPVGKSSSAVRLKGKVPSNLRNLPLAHRTVSAPSTPGYAAEEERPVFTHQEAQRRRRGQMLQF
ncbi:putative hamartin isoform X1 [Apostichopus japonicus]|uniref:Putative hamartin isoform X1 n=1 Tax=Stichopus japonicus TaxID=307972 RepID=A0A2G8LC68_STIJA|nr:putative hamartin isoform X1 [Apostichopus japonicus]